MDITNIVLSSGSHSSPDEGLCLLEAVAYVAGEPHSDHPVCTDPVLAAYGRAINDFMTDAERILLAPFITRLAGTAGDHELSLRRAMIIVDGQIRQILPLAFEAVGLSDVAASLRGLSPIVDEMSARAARAAVVAAESAAWSAADSSTAWSAAKSAAMSARCAESAARSARSAGRTADTAGESAAWSVRSATDGAARLTVCNAIVSIFKSAIELR